MPVMAIKQLNPLKTKELLAVLSNQEIQNLIESLKSHKRQSLELLLKALLTTDNQSEEIEKSMLFSAAFEEKYSPEKDYLLRNEFRLLNKEIEKFIILKQVSEVFKHNPQLLSEYYLNQLLQAKQYNLFDKEWKSAVRSCERNYNFDLLSKLHLMWVDYLRNHEEISLSNLDHLEKSLHTAAVYMETVNKMNQKRIELHREYSRRIANVIGEGGLSKKNVDLPAAHKDFIKHYNDYFLGVSQAYKFTGSEKLNYLQQSLISLNHLEKCDGSFVKDKIRVLGNIAVEYFINKQFTKADKWYNKALEAMERDTVMIDLIFNYAVNLLSLGQFREMTDLFYKYHQEILLTPKVRYRFEYFACLALAMMDKPTEAFKILNHELQQRPQKDYFYFRLIYAVLSFQKKDYDACLRELENIRQSPRYKRRFESEDLRMLKWFRLLARIFEKPLRKTERKQELESLSDAFIQEISVHPIDNTLLQQWFVKKLSEAGVTKLANIRLWNANS